MPGPFLSTSGAETTVREIFPRFVESHHEPVRALSPGPSAPLLGWSDGARGTTLHVCQVAAQCHSQMATA